MLKTFYSCDVCGTEASEPQRWFAVVWRVRASVSTLLVGLLGSIRDATDEAPVATQTSQLFHLCGHVCLLRKVSEFAEGGVNARSAEGL